MRNQPSALPIRDIIRVTDVQAVLDGQDVKIAPPLNRAERRAAKRSKLGLSPREAAHVRHLAQQIRLEQAAAEREARAEAERQRINALPFSADDNRHKVGMVFDPVDAFLNELETTGDIVVADDGTPLMWAPHDGANYPIVPALQSMCDTYTKLAQTHGWPDETDGMRKLAKRLELEMPIFSHDVAAARGTIAWMRQYTLLISPNEFSRESIEIQVRDEARALGLAEES
jgi:hypothetical protein